MLRVPKAMNRRSVALVAALGLLVSVGVSQAANAEVPGDFNIVVQYDGTGHGTADACGITVAPVDASTSDRVVCTNDQVGYSWQYSLAVGAQPRTVTFSQSMPAGTLFAPSNVLLLESLPGASGTASIVTNPDGSSTLTAQLTFAPNQSLSGAVPIVVNVTGKTPNGTVLQQPLTVSEIGQEPETLTPAAVTVRSVPEVDLRKTAVTLGTTERSGALGYVIHVSYHGFQGAGNGKGVSALENVITWQDDLSGMTPNTVLLGASFGGYPACGAGFSYFNTPDAGRFVSPGTLTCTQSAPGAPIQLTLTGADTSGYAPNGYQYPQLPTRTVMSGGFILWVPFSEITPGPDGMDVTNQFTGFDPEDASGQSNFGAGYEPGGIPSQTCADTRPGNPSPDNNNCVTSLLVVLTGIQGEPIVRPKFLRNPVGCWGAPPFQCFYLPGEGNGTLQQGQAGPGLKINANILFDSRNDGSVVQGLVVCDVFNPTQQQYDVTRSVSVNRIGTSFALEDPSTYRVQFASVSPFVGCGLPGDVTTEGPWFDDIDDAGGPENVNVVRVIDTSAGLTTPNRFWVSIPFVNVSTEVGLRVQDRYWGRWDGNSAVGSVASDTIPLSVNGYNVANSLLGIDKTVSPSATTIAAGQQLSFSLAPRLTSTSPLVSDQQVVTLVDTLPRCFVDPQPTATTLENWILTVQPANVGADGVACTGDDVSGTVLTFVSKEPLSTGVTLPSAVYTVRVAPTVGDQTSHTNTVLASTPTAVLTQTDLRSRTDSLTFTARSASQIALNKAVDLPVVEVAPDRVGWTLTFANQADQDAGETQFIDVFPWSGDDRGSQFFGSLDLAEVELFGNAGAGTVLEYTARASSSVNDDPDDASNGPAGTTVWCLPASFGAAGCPTDLADATAVRITITEFDIGWAGSVHLQFKPSGNREGDVYVNATGVGQSAVLPLPIPQSNDSQTRVVASTIGDTVWWDQNADGIQDDGEPGIPGVTVQLRDSEGSVITTVTTDDLGTYRFANLHSGTYRVTLDSATIPDPAVATYDLDGGIVSPDGDSGLFELGFDVDRVDADFGYRGLPSVDTEISNRLAAPNTEVTDAVTILGTEGASGTLTWTLYGPVSAIADGDSLTCVGVDWSAADEHTTGQVAFTGDGTVTTPSTLLVEEGCYSYVVVAAVDGIAEEATHAIGLPNETVLVVEPAGNPTGLDRGGPLSFTGVSPMLTAMIGFGLMLIAAGLALIVRRRLAG